MTEAAFPRARRFILDALHLDCNRPEPASASQMQAEDWDYLLRMATMHRLGPMLHERLGRGDLAGLIPQRVKNQLKIAHRKHALRNLIIYRELVAVTRIFDAAQIPSIALKGAFLARFSYPSPGLRPMRDLDLLLRPGHAVQAFELLKQHGYRPMFDGQPEAYFADRIHLPPLRGPSGISIELHHRLTAPDAQAADFDTELWGRSITKMIGGSEIGFLCPEDILLHLCLHAVLDHQFDLGPLALADVALLVETKAIDWQDFIKAVSDGNWQRPVLPVLCMAQRHLGAGIPGSVIQALGGAESDAAWLAAADYLLFSDPEDHKLLDYDVQEILYSGKFANRLATIAAALFPPRAVVARHFPVSADSPMAFLYYPLRWYRLLTKKLPSLLKAHSGRGGALRQLALQRSALSDWLQG